MEQNRILDVYLDNSATTLPCPEAVNKIIEMLTKNYGNPSSLHNRGLQAQLAVDEARKIIAQNIGAQEKEITFTSGGTESNNLAIFGAAYARKRMGKKIITTAIEHSSILVPMKMLEKEGWNVVYLKPDQDGKVNIKDLERELNDQTVLISMMLVNNETGAIQPVDQIKKLIQRNGSQALFHCDAVQAFGKLPIKVKKLGVDLMTISAHKIHGPKGIGALFVKEGIRILPRSFGGSQEKGLRPGTESTPLIAGFGAAVNALPDPLCQLEKMKELRSYLLNKISDIPDVVINSTEDGLPYLINLSCIGIRSEVMLHYLSANKGQKSHVLVAMELDARRIDSALRISFSRNTTKEEINIFASVLASGMKHLVKSRR